MYLTNSDGSSLAESWIISAFAFPQLNFYSRKYECNFPKKKYYTDSLRQFVPPDLGGGYLTSKRATSGGRDTAETQQVSRSPPSVK